MPSRGAGGRNDSRGSSRRCDSRLCRPTTDSPLGTTPPRFRGRRVRLHHRRARRDRRCAEWLLLVWRLRRWRCRTLSREIRNRAIAFLLHTTSHAWVAGICTSLTSTATQSSAARPVINQLVDNRSFVPYLVHQPIGCGRKSGRSTWALTRFPECFRHWLTRPGATLSPGLRMETRPSATWPSRMT